MRQHFPLAALTLKHVKTTLIHFKIMKIYRTLLLVCVFQCFFAVAAFAQGKINIILVNKPVREAIARIKEDTGYKFFFEKDVLNTEQLVSVNVKDGKIEDVLNQLLKGLPVEYIIQKNQILLKKKVETKNENGQQVNPDRLTVSGKVIDKDGMPVPGANVVLMPARVGTTTNANGEFHFSYRGGKSDNSELVISFIGMHTAHQLLDGRTNFTITLDSEDKELNQVVVTSSYGTRRLKEEVVGSITSIRAADIQTSQAFESVDKMLEGQIAGVNIESGASPLDPVKIDIRGQGTLSPLTSGSLTSSSQPLFIVDGVIMSEETNIANSFFDGSGTFVESSTNPIAGISPDDIQSISILRDAAAVSIYGADGANGVIIITTKKGSAGETRFSFSTQQGVQQAVDKIKYLNGEEYSEMRNEYLRNTGNEGAVTPWNGVDTDWFDLLNRTGYFGRYSLSASGGKDAFSFRVGVNYLDMNEAQAGNSSDQLRISSNLAYRKGKVNGFLSLNPSYTKKNTPNSNYGYAFAPNIAPYDENGDYSLIGVTGMGNPLAVIDQNRNQTEIYGLVSSLNLGVDLTDNWNVASVFGVDLQDKDQDRYFSGGNESGRPNGTVTIGDQTVPAWGRRVLNSRVTKSWNWNVRTSYKADFGADHHVDGVLGLELTSNTEDLDYAAGYGFLNPIPVNPVESAVEDHQTYNSDRVSKTGVSQFAQLNYDFKKKYYLIVNMRRDQSSTFGENVNTALNAGLGLSWNITREAFLRDVEWVNFLRLRLSYGSTGNSRIGSVQSSGIYNYTAGNPGYNSLDYAVPSTAPNPNLGWEKNNKFNLGFDFNFLTRFNLVVDYFHDDIHDMISSRSVPSETGFSTVQINASDMYNKGIEASLSWSIIKKTNFRWMTSVNVATLKSKITKVSGFGDSYSTSNLALALKEGQSTTTIWGVNYLGVDPVTGHNLVEKDGQTYDEATYRNLYTNADWEPIGDSQADVYGGFNNSFTINNRFTVNVRGSYRFGNDRLVSGNLIDKYNISSNRNLSVNAKNYWTTPGDVVTQPRVSSWTSLSNLSKYVYDASNIKIANISLSYRLPLKATSLLSSLELNADVSNVYTFYMSKSPEGQNGIREFYYTYPQARTYTLGVSLKF